MPGITETWDSAVPAGSEDPKNGDDRIRELKRTLVEILRNGDHKAQAGPVSDVAAGRHVCGQANGLGGTGALTGEFSIYASDGTTKIVQVLDSTASEASTFKLSTLNIKSATQRTLAIPLGGGATGVVGGVYFENRGLSTMTFLGAKLVCATAPSGSALDVDALRLTAGYANPGSGGSTIFTARPTVAAGSRVGSESTSLAITTLATGEALYFNIVALNSADNIVMYIRYSV